VRARTSGMTPPARKYVVRQAAAGDITVMLGSIVQELQTVSEILATIEQHPAISMTPAQHQRVITVASGT
jgi:hypothetical protein